MLGSDIIVELVLNIAKKIQQEVRRHVIQVMWEWNSTQMSACLALSYTYARRKEAEKEIGEGRRGSQKEGLICLSDPSNVGIGLSHVSHPPIGVVRFGLLCDL